VIDVTSVREPLTLETLWDSLNDQFIALYAEILRSTATVQWQAGHSDNQFYLMSAYASFRRVGCDDDQDLVIEVNLHRHASTVTWTADAGQSAGLMLADGPVMSVHESVVLSSWIGEAMDQTTRWLKAETPNFIAYLNQEPTPYDLD